MTNEQDRLASILTALGQAVDWGYAWSVYPSEAKALLAEIERLRAVVADQQMLLDEHRMDNQHAYEEGGNAERAAVVAWLNNAADTVYYDCCCGPVAACAEAIERGEHRKED